MRLSGDGETGGTEPCPAQRQPLEPSPRLQRLIRIWFLTSSETGQVFNSMGAISEVKHKLSMLSRRLDHSPSVGPSSPSHASFTIEYRSISSRSPRRILRRLRLRSDNSSSSSRKCSTSNSSSPKPVLLSRNGSGQTTQSTTEPASIFSARSQRRHRTKSSAETSTPSSVTTGGISNGIRASCMAIRTAVLIGFRHTTASRRPPPR